VGLQPWRVETFKFSTDPELEAKVRDVVGLYLNPPDKAVVLCVDDKSQVQALDRTAPILPRIPEKQTHDYVRHGTTTRWRKEGLEGIRRRLPCAKRTPPVGEWPLLRPAPVSTPAHRTQNYLTQLITVSGAVLRVGGEDRRSATRSVRRRSAATGVADLLSGGRSPTFALVTGLLLPATNPPKVAPCTVPEGAAGAPA
jgi:hypothetical protein